MQEVDITKLTNKELEKIVQEHSPSSHLRTKASDGLDRRYKLSESFKTTEILKLSKKTFILVIIATLATIIGVIIAVFK